MKAAGLVRCAYHFARLNENATAQAGFFVKTVNAAGGYKTGPTLQLMLDLESSPSSAGLSPAHIWSWVQEFLGSIKRLTGRPGIIYTGYSDRHFFKDCRTKPIKLLRLFSRTTMLTLWIKDHHDAHLFYR
jgi:GH25 family lysozyme M1 (1,4-beta-N-acetylmuramidase)